MSNHRRLWTEEEDSILQLHVMENPENLQKAFIAAGNALHRTKSACVARWYNILSKKEGKTNTAFYCISKKSYGRNRKNCTTELSSTEKRGFWKTILTKLFGSNN